jgi:hypothetical protein
LLIVPSSIMFPLDLVPSMVKLVVMAETLGGFFIFPEQYITYVPAEQTAEEHIVVTLIVRIG